MAATPLTKKHVVKCLSSSSFEGRLAIRCYTKGSTSLRFESNNSNSILDLACCEKPYAPTAQRFKFCRRDLPPSRSLRGLWLGQLRYVGVWTCQKYPKCEIHGTDFPPKSIFLEGIGWWNIDHRIQLTNGIYIYQHWSQKHHLFM